MSGTIAFRCDTCAFEFEVPATEPVVQQVRHTRTQTMVSVQPDPAAMGAAVVQHRQRGCTATHFTQTTEP